MVGKPAIVASLLLFVLAGCVEPGTQSPPVSAQTPWLVTSATAVEHCSNTFGDSCWEASLAALPNGTLVASDGFAESIARSFDGGHTWARIARPGWPQAQLAQVPGWSDTDSLVTATPDGRLVFSSIAATYNDAPDFLAGAATILGIHVAVSKDAGSSWVSNTILGVGDGKYTFAADRQWVAAGPKGEIYVSFAHYHGSPLFFAYAGPAFAIAPYTDDVEEIAHSTDSGATWSDFREVAPAPLSCQYGGAPVVAPDGTISIPLTRIHWPLLATGTSHETCLFDPTGTVAPDPTLEEFVVARSTDGGASFTTETVLSATATPDMPTLFPVLAGAPDGGLAAGWAREDGRVAIASRSAAGTWGAPRIWTPAGGNVTAPPGVVADAGGAIRISYMTHGAALDPAAMLQFAWGDATGPMGNVTLWGPTRGLGGANGDFANLVRLPDGRMGSALAVYDQPQRTFHVMALLAAPPA